MEEVFDITFNNKVIDYNNKFKKPFILYFYSDNCNYCGLYDSILTLLLNKYKNKIKIYKIKTNNFNITSTYKIKAVPSMLIFNSDKSLLKKTIGSNIDFKEIDNIFMNIIKEDVVFFKFLKLF